MTDRATANFIYDGLGRRKSKTIGGTAMRFWYDGQDILADLNGSIPTGTIFEVSPEAPFYVSYFGFYQKQKRTTIKCSDADLVVGAITEWLTINRAEQLSVKSRSTFQQCAKRSAQFKAINYLLKYPYRMHRVK